MTAGVRTEMVNIAKFGNALSRTPGLAARLFTERERHSTTGRPRPVASLAARYAAKIAVAKTLDAIGWGRFVDCEVLSLANGRPVLRISDRLPDLPQCWHVSLAHQSGWAVAVVLAEDPERTSIANYQVTGSRSRP